MGTELHVQCGHQGVQALDQPLTQLETPGGLLG